MQQPISLHPKGDGAVPATWKPPCPAGEHHLNILERRNGGDDDSDDDDVFISRQQDERAATSILFDCARRGDVEILRSALGTCPIDSCDETGATALLWSARSGHLECTRLLLEHRASVDLPERLGWTPLMEAAFANHPDTLRILLDARADPRLENRQLETALSQAHEVGSKACMALLREALTGEEVLLDAVKIGDVKELSARLAAGVKLSDVDELLRTRQSHHRERSTPLHWAAAHGHVECIDALIAHGAQINASAAGEGWTPLMAAVGNYQAKATAALLAAKADPHMQNASGKSALTMVGLSSNNPCALLLEEAVCQQKEAERANDKKPASSEAVVVRLKRPWLSASRLVGFMKAFGVAPRQMKAVGFDASTLRPCFGASQLKKAGFSAIDLANAGYGARELMEGGFQPRDLKDAGFSREAMEAAGYVFAAMKVYGCNCLCPNCWHYCEQQDNSRGGDAYDHIVAYWWKCRSMQCMWQSKIWY